MPKFCRLALTISLMVMHLQSISQTIQKNYIVLDSAFLMGTVEIISKTEINFWRINSYAKSYNATQIKEFDVDGETYESITRNGTAQFYRRLVAGKFNLYIDRGDFLIISEGVLTPLTKEHYQETLYDFFKCDNLERVLYAKASLVSFIDRYNQGGCQPFIQHPTIGVTSGFSHMSYERTLDVREFSSIENIFSLSAFFDMPLYSPRGIFITSELQIYYSLNNFYLKENAYSGYYESVNLNLVLPVGTKIVLGNKRALPFLKFGIMPSYLINKPTSPLIETFEDNSIIEITYSDISKTNQFSFGYFAGLGLEIMLAKKRILYVESRYANSSWSNNRAGFHWSALSMNFGYSF